MFASALVCVCVDARLPSCSMPFMSPQLALLHTAIVCQAKNACLATQVYALMLSIALRDQAWAHECAITTQLQQTVSAWSQE